MRDWMIENCVIYVCTTALVLGLFALSHSWHALWGLMMLVCLNSPKSK